MGRRLPESEFRGHPWRIHQFIDGFEVEDVWAVGARERAADFPRLVDLFALVNTEEAASPVVRFLFAARWKIGEWLGWDDPSTGVGARVPSLRDQLPASLRDTVDLNRFAALPFTPLFELPDEFAAETANKTMHGILHLGAVPVGGDEVMVRLTVLVKTNGLFGQSYMAFIKPFRYVLVYPALFRELEGRWERGAADRASAAERDV